MKSFCVVCFKYTMADFLQNYLSLFNNIICEQLTPAPDCCGCSMSFYPSTLLWKSAYFQCDNPSGCGRCVDIDKMQMAEDIKKVYRGVQCSEIFDLADREWGSYLEGEQKVRNRYIDHFMQRIENLEWERSELIAALSQEHEKFCVGCIRAENELKHTEDALGKTIKLIQDQEKRTVCVGCDCAKNYLKHAEKALRNAKKINPVKTESRLVRARRIINLQSFTIDDMISQFARETTKGMIGRKAFNCVFRKIILSRGNSVGGNKRYIEKLVEGIFETFDSNYTGRINLRDLMGGLSILCAGSRKDKVKGAFSLYDLNKEGLISLNDLSAYLTSMYKVLYVIDSDIYKRIGVTASEMAVITAEQAFIDMGIKDMINYDQFEDWFTLPGVGVGGDGGVGVGGDGGVGVGGDGGVGVG